MSRPVFSERFYLTVIVALAVTLAFFVWLAHAQTGVIDNLRRHIPPAPSSESTRGVERFAAFNAAAGGAGDSA